MHVGQSQPGASTWDWETAYTGPPEDGQPRAGSANHERSATPETDERRAAHP